MADLALLNIYKSNATLAVLLGAGSPIFGSGSLEVSRTAGSGGRINAVLNSGSRQFTAGRLRCATKYLSAATVSISGLCCMQSQEDISGAVGNAYSCQAEFNWDGSNNNRLRLLRVDTGLSDGSPVVLGTSANFALSPGTVMTLQFTWLLDPTNYGGVLLHVERGSALDFSDLAAVASLTYVTDASGYLTGTVGEGCWTSHGSSNGIITIDRLHSRRIVAGG